MTTLLPFGNNPIQVFAYEGFDFTISNPDPSTRTLQPVIATGGLNPAYFTQSGNNSIQFRSTGLSNTLTGGTIESFVLRVNDGSGNTVASSSNTVNIGAGRLLDSNGVTLSNTSYTFFVNENVAQTLGRPFRVVSPSFDLNTLTSFPALPPGFSFARINSTTFDISAIPLVTVPNTIYKIIGIGGGKVATTDLRFVVSNQRVQLDLSGEPIIGSMTIGTQITPRVLTAILPQGTSTVRYTFPSLPNGIVTQNILGSNVFSPFFPTDPSFTMIITGAPTLAAAQSFRTAGIDSSGTSITVRANAGLLESTEELTFAFGETVLFDPETLSNNFVGIPIDPSLNFFFANTYFANKDPITSITASSLPNGLSLDFIPAQSRANLTGTPSVASSTSHTVKAINSNGISAEIIVTIPILNDTVSFSTPVGSDICYNFILSRPLTQFKPGFYDSNIRFIASAASGRPVSLSAPALTGTGLSLDSNGLLVGLPSTVTPLTNLNVIATVIGSPATATKTVKFEILDDIVTIANVSPSNFRFVQNVPITPFQIPITSTLSDRNVIGYSQSGFPDGITISPSGLVSGTSRVGAPLNGNVTITATTGYASGSRDFSYNLIPDTILFTVPQAVYTYAAGDPVVIPVTGTSYSGNTVSNFVFGLPSTYGLEIGGANGLITGEWTTSIPPQQILPSSSNFNITAQSGVVGTFPVSFTASPVLELTSFVWSSNVLHALTDSNGTRSISTINTGIPELPPNGFDIVIRNNNVDGNFILATASNYILRSTYKDGFNAIQLGNVGNRQILSSLAFKSPADWWVSGTGNYGGTQLANLLYSEDGGISWDNIGTLPTLSRDSNSPVGSSNPYLSGGIALKYKTGVLMAGGLYDNSGGRVMIRSTNDGETWSGVSGEFTQEAAYFNFDASSIWVATGSDKYKTLTVNSSSWASLGSANTLKYSTNQGQTWSNALSGAFTMFGYELIYANNTWVATGVDGGSTYAIRMKYSTNGSNWSNVALPNPFTGLSSVPVAPLPLGSMNYDGSNWNVFAQRQNGGSWVSEIYSSSDITSSSWTVSDVTSSFSAVPNNSARRFLSYTRRQLLRPTESKIITIVLSFASSITGGPAITLPMNDSFLLYQYIQTSIQLASSGNDVYFFIATANLPPGMKFDQTTNIISGKPSQIGDYSTTIFAKNDDGVTIQTLKFTVVVPRIIRKQDGAAAYTSLLRQYTEVLGAQGARDNRAFPAQEKLLGSFMSPEAPEVITSASRTTKCVICQKFECPNPNKNVDGGNTDTITCSLIDGNMGGEEFVTVGNAGVNICE